MERNYWMHRITGGDYAQAFSGNLLFCLKNGKEGFISIGWSDLSQDSFAKDVMERGEKAIDSRLKEEGWGLPRNRWNLWRFIRGMKVGDRVIVPMPYEFHICEILDDEVFTNESMDMSLLIDWNGKPAKKEDDGYIYNSDGKAIDLGFYRRVKVIESHIPRADYADQDLTSRMKIRQTNALISDLKESVDKAMESYRRKKPINLKEVLLEQMAPMVLSSIRESLNDNKFERLVQWYLESLGAKVETPSKNESPTECGDADKVAYFDIIKTVIMVQIKKHVDITDSWAVEQINAFSANHTYDDYNTQLWVISSCDDFNEAAKRKARNANVRLINGIEFSKMILEAGLSNLVL